MAIGIKHVVCVIVPHRYQSAIKHQELLSKEQDYYPRNAALAENLSPAMTQEVTAVATPQSLPRYLLGISTKMYFSHAQTTSYLQRLATALTPSLTLPSRPKGKEIAEKLQFFYIPSFPSLYSCAQLLQSQKLSILLGGQDCSEYASGAHTGCVSAGQLREVGCSMVELGHAERRAAPVCESDALVAAKVRVAVEMGLIPLVCVGEKEKVVGESVSRRIGVAVEEVVAQVEPVLRRLMGVVGDGKEVRFVVFAYEPVWAIGAERPAEADHVVAVVRAVRELVTRRYLKQGGGLDGLEVRFLYGGSAGPGTWKALKGELDGLFLGRFAHDVENVQAVVQEMLE